MNRLSVMMDQNGNSMVGLNIPTYVNSRAIAANTAEAFTVPTGAHYVLLTANVDFFANFGATAVVPGDVTDGTAPLLNPSLRALGGSTSISVISAAAGIIVAEFYE